MGIGDKHGACWFRFLVTQGEILVSCHPMIGAGGRGRRTRRAIAVAAMVGAGLVALTQRPADATPSPTYFSSTPIASWRADGVGWTTLVVGQTLYVGGAFGSVTSPDGATVAPRTNLAAFDLATGALVSTFRADTNGDVRALATDGHRLFVGGAFTKVNGTSRLRLAALDPTTGAVDPTWRVDANSNVYAIGVGGDQLFAAGSFTTLAGVPRSRAGAVSLTTGVLRPWAPTLDNTAVSLAASPDGARVYLGGDFKAVNGTSRPWLVRTDDAGVVVPVPWKDLTGPALSLELDGSGTRLAAALGGSANAGVWYDTTSGNRLWRQVCDGDAQAIHVIGGTVISGFHEGCDGDSGQRVAATLADDGSRDLDFRPTFDRFWGARAIGGTPDALVVAGDFTRVSGVAVRGFAIFPARPAPSMPVSLPSAAVWRYRDNGIAPGAGWNQPGFDDRDWPSGPARLGYGDDDEATVVGYGSDPKNKAITTYFRTTFSVSDLPGTLTLRLVADDGAVVYLNGAEVVRDNMPSGTITPTTRAAGRSGAEENQIRSFDVPVSALVAGTNTIAVEVHQDSKDSSDLSFTASIESTFRTDPTTTTAEPTTTAPPDTTTTVTATTVPDTTTTTDPEATTTTAVADTTTTTVPEATTTTTTAPPSGPTTLYRSDFSLADGSPWPGWATSGSRASVSVVGGGGRIAYDDAAGAYGRAQLTDVAPGADGEVLLSYRWSATGAAGYLNLYLRGSGGWQNAYRPRDGYGIELSSTSSTVTVRRNSGGTLATIGSVSGGQQLTTARQWIRFRVVGTTISFRSWLDGQPEPAVWWWTGTDATVTTPGQVHLSLVRGGTNVGARSVTVDDMVVTDGA